jgi:hypothetical protein
LDLAGYGAGIQCTRRREWGVVRSEWAEKEVEKCLTTAGSRAGDLWRDKDNVEAVGEAESLRLERIGLYCWRGSARKTGAV